MLGQWSIPGGRVEKGETFKQTALREVLEETGVDITVGEMIAVFDTDMEDYCYKLHDFVAAWVSGEPRAGDDAMHAEFVSPEHLARIEMWHETRDLILSARTAYEGLMSSCEK